MLYVFFHQSVVPREETYLLSPSKFEQASNYILRCEDSLIGQAVVSRDNKTGLFHLCAVRDKVKGPRNYLIEWADHTLEIQVLIFVKMYLYVSEFEDLSLRIDIFLLKSHLAGGLLIFKKSFSFPNLQIQVFFARVILVNVSKDLSKLIFKILFFIDT